MTMVLRAATDVGAAPVAAIEAATVAFSTWRATPSEAVAKALNQEIDFSKYPEMQALVPLYEKIYRRQIGNSPPPLRWSQVDQVFDRAGWDRGHYEKQIAPVFLIAAIKGDLLPFQAFDRNASQNPSWKMEYLVVALACNHFEILHHFYPQNAPKSQQEWRGILVCESAWGPDISTILKTGPISAAHRTEALLKAEKRGDTNNLMLLIKSGPLLEGVAGPLAIRLDGNTHVVRMLLENGQFSSQDLFDLWFWYLGTGRTYQDMDDLLSKHCHFFEPQLSMLLQRMIDQNRFSPQLAATMLKNKKITDPVRLAVLGELTRYTSPDLATIQHVLEQGPIPKELRDKLVKFIACRYHLQLVPVILEQHTSSPEDRAEVQEQLTLFLACAAYHGEADKVKSYLAEKPYVSEKMLKIANEHAKMANQWQIAKDIRAYGTQLHGHDFFAVPRTPTKPAQNTEKVWAAAALVLAGFAFVYYQRQQFDLFFGET